MIGLFSLLISLPIIAILNIWGFDPRVIETAIVLAMVAFIFGVGASP